MAECGVCGKDKPVKKDYTVFTAIKRESTIKTGFKEYETKTGRPIQFKEHDYKVCADCERKYRQVYPWFLWVPLAILGLMAIAGIGSSEDSGVMEYACFCLAPLGAVGYWVYGYYLDIEKRLVRKAVNERKSGNWQAEVAGMGDLHRQQQGDPLANRTDHVVGFTGEKGRKISQALN